MICDFWVSVKEYEGYLIVSASGEVRSLDRIVYRSDTGKGVLYRGVLLTQQTDKCGYSKLRISVNGIKESISVHRIVAESFIDNPENKPQVNHLDGFKSNNNLSNLEWSTNGENQKHAIAKGLRIVKTGKTSHLFVSEVSVYKDGKYLYNVSGNIEMAEKGFDYRLVSAVILGKRKSHKGHTFKRN